MTERRIFGTTCTRTRASFVRWLANFSGTSAFWWRTTKIKEECLTFTVYKKLSVVWNKIQSAHRGHFFCAFYRTWHVFEQIFEKIGYTTEGSTLFGKGNNLESLAVKVCIVIPFLFIFVTSTITIFCFVLLVWQPCSVNPIQTKSRSWWKARSISERMTTESFEQAGFKVEDVGKTFPSSKKRVTWKFYKRGNAVPHVVSLVWSKYTGKQTVFMDGKEVWFGRKEGSSVVTYNWTTRDGTTLHILACRTTPTTSASGAFRKYDLILGNQTFSSLRRFEDGVIPIDGQNSKHPSSIVELLYPQGYRSDVISESATGLKSLQSVDEYISTVVSDCSSSLQYEPEPRLR